MLCCLLAALGFAGAWIAHQLRWAGALLLLITGVGASGALLWDHLGRADGAEAHAAATKADSPSSAISICSGRRAALIRDYPLY